MSHFDLIAVFYFWVEKENGLEGKGLRDAWIVLLCDREKRVSRCQDERRVGTARGGISAEQVGNPEECATKNEVRIKDGFVVETLKRCQVKPRGQSKIGLKLERFTDGGQVIVVAYGILTSIGRECTQE